MQISKREKRMIVAMGILSVLVAVYMFFYQPTVRRAQEALAQVEAEQQTLEQMIAKWEENERLSEELSLITDKITSVFKVLPETDDEPGLIKYLHHMFAPFGGKESIYIEDPVMQEEFSMVRVRLSHNVSHNSFRALLRLLEISRYKNSLDNFSVHMQEGEGDDVVAVDMSLTFYFSNQ